MARETHSSIPVLQFAAEAGSLEPASSCLPTESLPAFIAGRRNHAATVCLLREEKLAILREPRFRELLEDRGSKHDAVALSRLLLDRDKAPFIKGSYASEGQLLRSVRALLAQATQRQERGLYFIAVPDALFSRLWKRAEARAQPVKPGDTAGAITEQFTDDAELLSWLKSHHGEPPADLAQNYVGAAPAFELVRCLIDRAARVDTPVLILGETGTGKEIIAYSIHHHPANRRTSKSFAPINCSALPEQLLESELFGYRRGAFTGAAANKPGLWEHAHGGTLFLDEIGDMSLAHQARILRVLEERRYRPVGGREEIAVDVRVIAATNRDLPDLIRQGRFREDLYYRLRSLTIHTPALREHPGEIPALANHFWAKIIAPECATLPGNILRELARHDWPGNARELRGVLNHLHALGGRSGADLDLLRIVLKKDARPGEGA